MSEPLFSSLTIKYSKVRSAWTSVVEGQKFSKSLLLKRNLNASTQTTLNGTLKTSNWSLGWIPWWSGVRSSTSRSGPRFSSLHILPNNHPTHRFAEEMGSTSEKEMTVDWRLSRGTMRTKMRSNQSPCSASITLKTKEMFLR